MAVWAEAEVVDGDTRIEATEDARAIRLRGVDDDHGPCLLAEGQPEPSTVRRDRQVMSAGTDGKAVDDVVRGESDRHQLATLVVSDVGPLRAGSESGEMWGAEVAEHLDHPE